MKGTLNSDGHESKFWARVTTSWKKFAQLVPDRKLARLTCITKPVSSWVELEKIFRAQASLCQSLTLKLPGLARVRPQDPLIPSLMPKPLGLGDPSKKEKKFWMSNSPDNSWYPHTPIAKKEKMNPKFSVILIPTKIKYKYFGLIIVFSFLLL